ncbi:MAG: aspartate--ammonia ligase [Bacteroidales bacterium]|nr:aspartate--ammonia ligase [Bacteroidales bacterium]
MSKLTLPKDYKPLLSLQQTEQGIKSIKDFFQQSLASQLRLRRVTAPLFVKSGLGINDDLNGIERPVRFAIGDMNDTQAEIVHSLAKWKRMTLAEYNIPRGYGIYTDMNAIRPDEELDNLHSLYVDQWDWEAVMGHSERTLAYLKSKVDGIYNVLLQTEYMVYEQYHDITPILPEKITYIHSQELLDRYPGLSPKERENEITRKYGAVFVIGIGGALSDGKPHDGRAPDYDDWSSEAEDGRKGLNGDILLWNPVLETAFEISSMGIRVDAEALHRQLEISGQQHRAGLYFHRRLAAGELPQSIGGGIGQSRLCMFLLRKGHIGEIQSSIWPDDMRQQCKAHGMQLI